MNERYQAVSKMEYETVGGVRKRRQVWVVKDLSTGEIVSSHRTWQEAEAVASDRNAEHQRQEQLAEQQRLAKQQRDEEEQKARESLEGLFGPKL